MTRLRIFSMNIPAIQLTAHVCHAGRISAKGCLLLVLYYSKMLLAIPSIVLQKLFYSGKIRKTQISYPPVFILGHYRSGTTYLHKLMSTDPRLGIISNYDMVCPNSSLLIGKWMERFIQFVINIFKIKTSFFNNFIPQMTEPAEEDRFLMNKGSAFSSYWGFILPSEWREWLNEDEFLDNPEYSLAWKKEYVQLLKQFTYKNKGKQLVLKNPPNTARIKWLLELFPDAKFIYIERNPVHVFYSMKNMWMKAIRKYCLQSITEKQVEEMIFGHFDFLLSRYEQDKSLIEKNLVEVKYEELEKDPLTILKRIYEELEIPGFENAKNRIKDQLVVESKYVKFSYAYDEKILERIKTNWKRHISKWESKSKELIEREHIDPVVVQ